MSIEVQHLLTLVERTQFDTIYHEHFQYYTVLTAQRALASGGLALVDVELLRHARRVDPAVGAAGRGGGRAVAGGRATCSPRSRRPGCTRRRGTTGSPPRCRGCGTTWCAFLIEARRAGKTVVGYGAPGKGNTLLNYCGIRPDLLAYTVDRNPYKHGRFTPGTRIPVLAPDRDRGRPAGLRPGTALEPPRRS